ncbi:MAG: CHAT domain-containing protein, partial [Acidimicrobiales bacterium]
MQMLAQDRLKSRGEFRLLGACLFDLLFEGDARTFLHRQLSEIPPKTILRFVLQFGPQVGRLGELPWEFLYVPNETARGGWPSASPTTPSGRTGSTTRRWPTPSRTARRLSCSSRPATSAQPDSFAGFRGVALRLLEVGVPAVVAMSFDIDVATATKFAVEFYKALADGRPVDFAVQKGRRKVGMPDESATNFYGRAFGCPVAFVQVGKGLVPGRYGADGAPAGRGRGRERVRPSPGAGHHASRRRYGHLGRRRPGGLGGRRMTGVPLVVRPPAGSDADTVAGAIA